ncbi:MAG: DUF6290 family protein [Candidatus Adiutrix sp.]|jgi:predicted DNA-binding protein|nr:DUF6290 family protein [Candidatus Adiutrix sp.]
MTSILVPEEIDRAFAALAAETSLAKHELVEKALRDVLEDQADIKLADEAMREYLAGDEKPCSLDEMKKKLGLVD